MPIDITALTDEQLISLRNHWNEILRTVFYVSSGEYDTAATFVKELELEMHRRHQEGPPWLFD